MKHWIKTILTGLLSGVLMACGGGGSEPQSSVPTSPQQPAGTTPAAAQGLYVGSYAPSSFAFPRSYALITPDDDYWIVYGLQSGADFTAYGLAKGRGASSNGSFTSSSVFSSDYQGRQNLGTLSAAYTSGSRFQADIKANMLSFQTDGTYASPGSFNYEKPAAMSELQGVWNGVLMRSNYSARLTVESGNKLSLGAGPCNFNGTVQPSVKGKNYFVVTGKYGDDCNFPAYEASGVIWIYQPTLSSRQVFLLLTSNRLETASIFIGKS